MYRGTARQPHNAKCRDRFRELLKNDARVKNTEVRKAEFEEREADKRKKKEEKKEEKKRKKEVEAEEDEESKRPRDADEGTASSPMETDAGTASGSGNQGVDPSSRDLIGVANPRDSEGMSSSLNEPTQGLKRDLEENRDIDIQQVERFIGEWVEEYQSGQMICEVEDDGEIDEESKTDDLLLDAWDDVHGGALPFREVKSARKEEIGFMESRNIWSFAPISESWEKLGKAPVTVRWVDVNKGGEERMEVRSRLVARD